MDATTASLIRNRAKESCPPLGYALNEAFTGFAAGREVHVVGNGPSARDFTRPDGAVVIACNGAVKRLPDADVWLTSESTVFRFPWFYDNESFSGISVHEQFIVHRDSTQQGGFEYLGAYSADYWQRVVWFNRRDFYHGWTIREAPYGLVYWNADGVLRGEPLGSVAMQAWHLAGLMGASKVHLHGCEFYFPQGEQHADGWSPYKALPAGEYGLLARLGELDKDEFAAVIVAVVNFRLDNGEPVYDANGPFQSTAYFIESSKAWRKLLAMTTEVETIDHSGGLLNPAALEAPAPAKVKVAKRG